MSHSIVELPDAAATLALGGRLAAPLRPGSVIALNGELGAGKTTLVRGLVAGLGSADPVSSPTFALVHEYRGGRLPVSHFDWYRLGDEAELWALGWEEYLDGGGVVVVEWAGRFPAALPSAALRWSLSHDAAGGRIFRGDAEPPP